MKEVSTNNFEAEVLKNDKPVIVDFWAPWCQPCLMFAPVFEEVSRNFSDAVFVKLNVDNNPVIASQFGVMSIPTVKIFKSGEIVGELIGALPKETFSERIREILK